MLHHATSAMGGETQHNQVSSKAFLSVGWLEVCVSVKRLNDRRTEGSANSFRLSDNRPFLKGLKGLLTEGSEGSADMCSV